MSIQTLQNCLSSAQAYGTTALTWVTTNGSALLGKLADLAMRVWTVVQPHLESLKNLVMANQGVATVVGVVVGAVALALASCSRVTNFVRNALGMGGTPTQTNPNPVTPTV